MVYIIILCMLFFFFLFLAVNAFSVEEKVI